MNLIAAIIPTLWVLSIIAGPIICHRVYKDDSITAMGMSVISVMVAAFGIPLTVFGWFEMFDFISTQLQ